MGIDQKATNMKGNTKFKILFSLLAMKLNVCILRIMIMDIHSKGGVTELEALKIFALPRLA